MLQCLSPSISSLVARLHHRRQASWVLSSTEQAIVHAFSDLRGWWRKKIALKFLRILMRLSSMMGAKLSWIPRDRILLPTFPAYFRPSKRWSNEDLQEAAWVHKGQSVAANSRIKELQNICWRLTRNAGYMMLWFCRLSMMLWSSSNFSKLVDIPLWFNASNGERIHIAYQHWFPFKRKQLYFKLQKAIGISEVSLAHNSQLLASSHRSAVLVFWAFVSAYAMFDVLAYLVSWWARRMRKGWSCDETSSFNFLSFSSFNFDFMFAHSSTRWRASKVQNGWDHVWCCSVSEWFLTEKLSQNLEKVAAPPTEPRNNCLGLFDK